MMHTILEGIQYFRASTISGDAGSGLYADSMYTTSSSWPGQADHFSSAGAGFGMMGLCFDYKMNRTTIEDAALKLHESIAAFHAEWYLPFCTSELLCAHWLERTADSTALQFWGDDEYSTIDTALYLVAAHFAVECLQPYSGATAAALLDDMLLNMTWALAMPESCEETKIKMRLDVADSVTYPWNEYHILAYTAAAAAAAAERRGLSSQSVGRCPPLRYYHRYWRPDAYESDTPGNEYSFEYGPADSTDSPLLTDCCSGLNHAVNAAPRPTHYLRTRDVGFSHHEPRELVPSSHVLARGGRSPTSSSHLHRHSRAASLTASSRRRRRPLSTTGRRCFIMPTPASGSARRRTPSGG